MLNTVVVIFLVIASALAGVPRTNVNHLLGSRIAGGKAAPDGAYPHIVSLQRGGPMHKVAGAIIDNEWVFTSANFVSGEKPSNWAAYAGSVRLFYGGTSYKVREIHIHENYNPDTYENNVAILKVQRITYTDKIQPIVIETEDVGGDENVTLAGWGALTGGFRPDYLGHIALKTSTVEECQRKLPDRPISNATICTSNGFGQGACNGDYGDPLIRTVNGQSRLVGIIAWFVDCGRNIPDVYSRASSYREWFNSICNCLN